MIFMAASTYFTTGHHEVGGEVTPNAAILVGVLSATEMRRKAVCLHKCG